MKNLDEEYIFYPNTVKIRRIVPSVIELDKIGSGLIIKELKNTDKEAEITIPLKEEIPDPVG